jgi:hypothetical protein
VADDHFVPWRIRRAWAEVRGAADDADKASVSQTVGPFEVTPEEVGDLERRLNSEWKSVKFKLARQRGSDGLAYITVSLQE